MSEEIQLVYYEPCEKITGFDILLSDPYAGGGFKTIDMTVNLNLQQVWEFLCEGGDWSFVVTPHGRPNEVFMRGAIYHDHIFRHSVDGQRDYHLCYANSEEMGELKEKVHKRLRKEMHDEQTRIL
jgi:hypothetical protein